MKFLGFCFVWLCFFIGYITLLSQTVPFDFANLAIALFISCFFGIGWIFSILCFNNSDCNWPFLDGSFLWASGPMLILAYMINNVMLHYIDLLTVITVIGPITEECLKLGFLYFLYHQFSLEYDNCLLLMCACVIGVTFGAFENMTYFYRHLAMHPDEYMSFTKLILSRGLFIGMVHASFMMPFVWTLITRRNVLIGLLVSIGMHSLFNNLAIFAPDQPYFVYLILIVIPIYVIALYSIKKYSTGEWL